MWTACHGGGTVLRSAGGSRERCSLSRSAAQPAEGQEAAAAAGCEAEDVDDPAEVLVEAAGAAASEVELEEPAEAVDAVETPELAESVE